MPRENIHITAGYLGFAVFSTVDTVDLRSDTVDLVEPVTGKAVITKAVYVGVAGNLVFWPAGQTSSVTYYNLPVGKWPLAAKRIGASTTADEVVIDYDLPNV